MFLLLPAPFDAVQTKAKRLTTYYFKLVCKEEEQVERTLDVLKKLAEG